MSGSQLLLLGNSQVTDPYYEYTTLLLPGNGTNGAQNNTFLDSSTNNFTITRNGNTTQGTFSPFSQTGWSNYSDGSGDYLNFTDSSNALDLGGSAASVEMWIYFLDVTTTKGIFTKGGGVNSYSTTNGIEYLLLVESGLLKFFYNTGGASTNISGSVVVNQWTHIVIATDASNNIAMFINGVKASSSVNAITKPTTRTAMRIAESFAGTQSINAYISNVSFVTGVDAYNPAASSITVPTSPLTAGANTKLLTCQSNRFRDASTNNFAITRNGDISVQSFSPFNPTAAWSASTNGGSGYYDGSGDWLTVNGNTAFAFSGEYTVECWIYPLVQYTSSSGYVGFVCMLNNPSGFILFIDGANGITLGAYGVANQIQTLTYPTARMWNHLAVSRNASNVTSVFLNGTRIGTGTFSTSYTSTSGNNLEIGTFATSAGPFTGYMSGVRLVKGTAVYDPAQTSITVPTAPLTAIANTSLLLNYTNAGIYDATSKNDLETVGNAQISTTQSKFGGSSMYFDGTGDNLVSQNNVDLQMGTGDFTVEAWVYVTAAPGSGARARIYSFQNHAASQVVLALAVINTGGTLYGDAILRSADGTGITIYTGVTAIPLNTWTHLALTRYSSTGRLFVNGVLQDTETSQTQNLSQALPACIGAANNATEYLTGYIDDLRITKGYARYTAAFTPPTAAFPLL